MSIYQHSSRVSTWSERGYKINVCFDRLPLQTTVVSVNSVHTCNCKTFIRRLFIFDVKFESICLTVQLKLWLRFKKYAFIKYASVKVIWINSRDLFLLLRQSLTYKNLFCFFMFLFSELSRELWMPPYRYYPNTYKFLQNNHEMKKDSPCTNSCNLPISGFAHLKVHHHLVEIYVIHNNKKRFILFIVFKIALFFNCLLGYLFD